ncbi:MAG: FtsW/RodA/SpoVE family cell cycle protein [Planctomycetota bacterium]
MRAIANTAFSPVRFEWSGVRLSPPARLFVSAVLVLLAIGLVAVLSASSYRAGIRYGDPTTLLVKQCLGAALGGLALVLAMHLRPEFWLRLSPVFFGVTLAALAATYGGIGLERNDARRWINLGGFVLQPTELAKLAIPLLFAWLFHKYPFLHWDARQFRSSVLHGSVWQIRWRAERWQRLALRSAQLGILALVVGLIAKQPDYGSAFFVLTSGLLMLLLTRLPWPYLVAGFTACVPAAIWLYNERKAELTQRLDGLLNPERVDQVYHSLLAIGSGGWFGKGVGLGDEKRLFLPEEYNDFIFSVFAEETGFIGVCVLVLLFSILLQSGWRIVRECPHPALRLLGFALVVNLVAQAVVNIAVATASAPTKGIGLPFISHGSSSLCVMLLEVGILLSIARVRVARDAK